MAWLRSINHAEEYGLLVEHQFFDAGPNAHTTFLCLVQKILGVWLSELSSPDFETPAHLTIYKLLRPSCFWMYPTVYARGEVEEELTQEVLSGLVSVQNRQRVVHLHFQTWGSAKLAKTAIVFVYEDGRPGNPQLFYTMEPFSTSKPRAICKNPIGASFS